MTETKDNVSASQREDRKIPEPERRGERLAGLLVLGLAVLNFPLLSIFSGSSFVCGIPVLYFYLFSVWSLIVGVSAYILRNRPAGTDKYPGRQDPGD